TAVEVRRAPDYEKRSHPSPQRRRSGCRTECLSYRQRKRELRPPHQLSNSNLSNVKSMFQVLLTSPTSFNLFSKHLTY
ncbi:hypothetical protein CEXT_178181, partial [Caerostris extrusa]